MVREFRGGPVVRTPHASTAGGPGSIPGPGTNILCAAVQPKEKKKANGENFLCIPELCLSKASSTDKTAKL